MQSRGRHEVRERRRHAGRAHRRQREGICAPHDGEGAHALGMDHTTFRNASGLPNPNQKTTARDLAALGLALKRDFPQYFSYFSTPDFTWAGVTFQNHSKLLAEFPGTTGLKTQVHRGLGFSLATSVTRDGHDLIAVVLGGRTRRAISTWYSSSKCSSRG
ncbi:MAG: hypothetical protein U1E87_04665 [Alphaproteobacteria bacterium]